MDQDQQFKLENYHHWIDEHVRFSDLDPLGHVNNNSISQYFENARAHLYMEITPEWPHGEHFFVLAHSGIDYRRELHMPAEFKIGTAVLKIGRTSLTVANALFHGEHGVAWCQSVSVMIHHTTRRPVEISPDLRVRCEKFLCQESSS